MSDMQRLSNNDELRQFKNGTWNDAIETAAQLIEADHTIRPIDAKRTAGIIRSLLRKPQS